MVSKNESQGLINFAIYLAKKSAEEILKIKKRSIIRVKKSQTDPTTQADMVGEVKLRSIIEKVRPDDGILGEEGTEKQSKNKFRWVFDPIDGTVNYLYRIPHWAVCIAGEKFQNNQWIPIIGVVYDVMRDELFAAVKGEGAYLNNLKIKVSKKETISQALIATEFSYIPDNRSKQVQILVNILPQIRDIRSNGSSALDICWVAMGRFDGFYESELQRWDWSAAAVILKEAGGVISPYKKGVIAAPKPLYKKLSFLISNQHDI